MRFIQIIIFTKKKINRLIQQFYKKVSHVSRAVVRTLCANELRDGCFEIISSVSVIVKEEFILFRELSKHRN